MTMRHTAHLVHALASTQEITRSQMDLLRVAARDGSVRAYMQKRRSVEKLATLGLLQKVGLIEYELTDAGRAVYGKYS